MSAFRSFVFTTFFVAALGGGTTVAMHNEYITHFQSDITVKEDASLLVQETITVQSTGRHIKRGITRDFPTRYHLPGGFVSNRSFEVQSVHHNGNPASFNLVDHANGKHMYIGDPNKMLSPGLHTYTIVYKTDRQLGFFDTHDELYWNVTGNDTPWPINAVSVRVALPASVPADKIKAEGYTGLFGQKQQNYAASIDQDGTIIFNTTRVLQPHAGLTIVVSWPKGFVTEPSQLVRTWYFIKDNWALWILLLGVIGLFLFYLWAYYYVRKDIIEGTIIPLFYPPQNMLPGGVRYIMKKGYDSLVTSADVVNMAVMQAVSISYEKNFFGGGRYTLIKKEKPNKKENLLYAQVYDVLFSSQDKVALERTNASTVQRVITDLKNYYYNQFGSSLFKGHTEYLLAGILISIFIIGIAVVASVSWLWLVPCCIFVFIMTFYFAHYLEVYTQEGQKLKEEIEGFKLFLGTTETERLNVIGTPPTKTPELYETYLPYAIALGVEEQWTQQFAPVFARLEQQGHAYTPVWYTGAGQFNVLQMGNLSSGLNHSIASSVISASTQVPGSSSGSGGSGSSGGGGGGGGVGGW